MAPITNLLTMKTLAVCYNKSLPVCVMGCLRSQELNVDTHPETEFDFSKKQIILNVQRGVRLVFMYVMQVRAARLITERRMLCFIFT